MKYRHQWREEIVPILQNGEYEIPLTDTEYLRKVWRVMTMEQPKVWRIAVGVMLGMLASGTVLDAISPVAQWYYRFRWWLRDSQAKEDVPQPDDDNDEQPSNIFMIGTGQYRLTWEQWHTWCGFVRGWKDRSAAAGNVMSDPDPARLGYDQYRVPLK